MLKIPLKDSLLVEKKLPGVDYFVNREVTRCDPIGQFSSIWVLNKSNTLCF